MNETRNKQRKKKVLRCTSTGMERKKKLRRQASIRHD